MIPSKKTARPPVVEVGYGKECCWRIKRYIRKMLGNKWNKESTVDKIKG